MVLTLQVVRSGMSVWVRSCFPLVSGWLVLRRFPKLVCPIVRAR